MPTPLSDALDQELEGILTRLNEENESRQKVVRMNSFGTLLRSLRMLCKTPEKDPAGEQRMEQAERLQGEMSREQWISDELRSDISTFLQHYVEWSSQ